MIDCLRYVIMFSVNRVAIVTKFCLQ